MSLEDLAPVSPTPLFSMTGGVELPAGSATLDIRAAPVPISAKLLLPLAPSVGPLLTPVVKTGQAVIKGQLLARAHGDLAVPLHAPTSGLVGDVVYTRDRTIPTPEYLELFPDHLDSWGAITPHEKSPNVDRNKLIEIVGAAGIAGMGGAGFPTAAKLAAITKLELLIVNGVESEPDINADAALFTQSTEDVIAGAQLLARVFSATRVVVAVTDRYPAVIDALQHHLRTTSIELAILPRRYPSGSEQQLIQILTGRTISRTQAPVATGVLVQNTATVRAIWRATRLAEPLIERWISVAGNNLTCAPCTLRVLIGTPVRDVLDHLGWRSDVPHQIRLGGPMMGQVVVSADVPVTKTTNGIWVETIDQSLPAEPCIRCGDCVDVCPANLLPQQLLWHSQSLLENQDAISALTQHNLFDCIECAACSYVCPSHIPLVPIYQEAKQQLRQRQQDKLKADRARFRFNQRQARFAKQDAEKALKRQRRQDAAEAARAELATSSAETNSLVAQALARVAANANDPQQQLARLERNLTAALGRLQRAEEILADAANEDAARREKLSASVKQAQQKVTEAQAKLAEQRQLISGGEKILAKLNSAPSARSQHAIDTLHKHLHVAQSKLAQATAENKPTAQALALGVEKLQAKLTQAQAEHAALSVASKDLPGADQPDPVMLAAAERALQNLAAKQQQSPVAKQAALKESIERRVIQLEQRIAEAREQQLPSLIAREASLVTLREKLAQLMDN